VLPGRSRLHRPGLVGQLGVVHMQWAAYGVAVLVRRSGLRAAARAALPNPRPRPRLHVRRRATRLIGAPLPLQGAARLTLPAEIKNEPQHRCQFWSPAYLGYATLGQPDLAAVPRRNPGPGQLRKCVSGGQLLEPIILGATTIGGKVASDVIAFPGRTRHELRPDSLKR